MKIHTLGSKYNAPDCAYTTDIRPKSSSNIKANNMYYKVNAKYSKRKHWVEVNKKGEYRYCYASFNTRTDMWTKPQREKYIQFVAIVQDFGKFKKIYINVNTHSSYILIYIDNYIFDDAQMRKLNELLEIRQ